MSVETLFHVGMCRSLPSPSCWQQTAGARTVAALIVLCSPSIESFRVVRVSRLGPRAISKGKRVVRHFVLGCPWSGDPWSGSWA